MIVIKQILSADFSGLRLSVIFSITVAIFFSACSKSDDKEVSAHKKTIHIAVSKTPLSTPFYIAENQGYFLEQGLTIKIIDTIGGHRSLKAVLSGKADMGTVSDYPVMMNSFKRNDYAITATFVSSDNDVKLIARKSSGIKTPADLKGKKIGTSKGTSSHFFMDRFLLFNGLSLNDVTIVNIAPENMTAAIKNAEVDALSVWEPYACDAKKALKDDGIIFPPSNYYRETFNLVGTKAYLEKNTITTQKILYALERAIKFIKNKPKEAQSILTARLKLDDELIRIIWRDFDFKLSLEQSLIITLENEARWAIENNIVPGKKNINFLKYFDFKAMEKVNNNEITIIR